MPEREPEPEKPKVNPLSLYPAKGNTDNSKNNEGITNGKGNQGNPSGSPDSKNYTNAMSTGAGIVPNLNGRVATSLPIPEYRSQEEGQVVVNIWVDKDGNVTQAEAGAKGSTTTDPTLLNAAKKAALQAKFNIKSDAPILQKGSITYKFRLQ